MKILKQHLPANLVSKLTKYVTSNSKSLQSHLNWTTFKCAIDKHNMDKCSHQIEEICMQKPISKNNVTIFHIKTNGNSSNSTEPNHTNTTQMIFDFLTHIYQRNIIASIVKYILLKPILTQLDSCKLIRSYKSIFYTIKARLLEMIFECILTSFNGSNYDNYLLCNSLIIIQTYLQEKINIFKKGSSISTIHLNIRNNINCYGIFNQPNLRRGKKLKQKQNNQWQMQLFIKDIRNLVSANMSLDKVGKLFNLNVPKLCFPYAQATSINKLKSCYSLHPHDESFWMDSFSNKKVLLETRLEAQNMFDENNFNDLYEYSCFYLIQDCILLHSITITLYTTYLKDSINIFIRRNYSQSNLAYQQLFIIEPSKQIENVLAPKQINNTFYNYFIKQAVTGGLCTSFVHGKINNDTIINEHFNYISNPGLDGKIWPNFENLNPWKKHFVEKPIGINTIDIRSLYPSASVKKMPVNTPLFFSRFTPDDFQKVKNQNYITLHLQSFCENVRESGSIHHDYFKLINKRPRFQYEYHALNHYLKSLPTNITILRFQSYFTALGQLYFTEYPIDGFLSYKLNNGDDTTFIKIIQYQSSYFHGHSTNLCQIENNVEQQQKIEQTISIKNKIIELYQHFIQHFHLSKVKFEYVEIFDCAFPNHKIPANQPFLFQHKNIYTYKSFVDNILSQNLTGFLIVKNLEIKKNNQNPIFGFIIQKVEYDLKHLSEYTKHNLSHFNKFQRVISIHKNKSFMVISTEYFLWLHKTFGFENPPDIYHALLFQLDYYLKKSIEKKLQLRKELKILIKNENNVNTKQVYEIRSELIKLMLNSCYGFTLCNTTSSKFKIFQNRTHSPQHRKRINTISSCIQIANNVYFVEKKKKIDQPFQTLLGHVGCYILFHSKIILLKRLLFMLQYLNPTKAQLLYMDTDSAHFLVKYKLFEDNVDYNLRYKFNSLYNKHFETGNKISGIWVQEGFFELAEYIGEKNYRLYNTSNTTYVTHMKGLNQYFQEYYHKHNINPKENPYIHYNIFYKSADFLLFKSYMSKNLFTNYIPVKRYFVSESGSLPLKLY
jgi:hypothetical protein